MMPSSGLGAGFLGWDSQGSFSIPSSTNILAFRFDITLFAMAVSTIISKYCVAHAQGPSFFFPLSPKGEKKKEPKELRTQS